MGRKGLPSIAAAVFRLFDFSSGRPRRTLGLWFLVVASLVPALFHLKTELRIYEIKDPTFPSTERLQLLKEDFEEGNSAVFIFARHERSTPLSLKQLCAIRHFVKEESETNAEIQDAVSPFRFRKARVEKGALLYPLLIQHECDSVTSASDKPATDLAHFQGTPWEGALINRDLSDLAVEFKYRNTQDGKFEPHVIGLTLERAIAELEKPELGLKVYLTGRTAPQYQFWKAIRKDIRVNFAIAGVILILLRVLLGTWSSGLLFLFSLVISSVLTVGALSLFGSPLDVLNCNFFMMLCVAGVEDFLFVHYLQLRNGRTVSDSYREMLVPGFFTTLTTFLGFISLLTSDVEMVRRFGVWAGVGCAAEWGVTFFLLPSLVRWMGPKVSWVAPERAWRLPQFVERLRGTAPRRAWLVFALFLFAGGVAGFNFLNYDDSMNENFPRGHLHRETFEYTRQTRGWEGIVQVVFNHQDDLALKQRLLAALRASPEIDRVSDQESEIQFQKNGLPEADAGRVERDLRGGKVLRRYTSPWGQERALLYLKSFKLSSLNEVSRLIKNHCPKEECFLAGEGMVYAEFSNRIISALLTSFVTSLLLVGGILLWLARRHSWREKIAIVFSSIWGPMVMIGVIAVLRLPVSQLTSLFAAVLVGLTGDNAIQFLFAARKGSKASGLNEGIDAKSEAAIAVGLTLCLSSLCFVGLTLVPLKTLGYLFFGGFLVTLIGDLWILKGLLRPRG